MALDMAELGVLGLGCATVAAIALKGNKSRFRGTKKQSACSAMKVSQENKVPDKQSSLDTAWGTADSYYSDVNKELGEERLMEARKTAHRANKRIAALPREQLFGNGHKGIGMRIPVVGRPIDDVYKPPVKKSINSDCVSVPLSSFQETVMLEQDDADVPALSGSQKEEFLDASLFRSVDI